MSVGQRPHHHVKMEGQHVQLKKLVPLPATNTLGLHTRLAARNQANAPCTTNLYHQRFMCTSRGKCFLR